MTDTKESLKILQKLYKNDANPAYIAFVFQIHTIDIGVENLPQDFLFESQLLLIKSLVNHAINLGEKYTPEEANIQEISDKIRFGEFNALHRFYSFARITMNAIYQEMHSSDRKPAEHILTLMPFIELPYCYHEKIESHSF